MEVTNLTSNLNNPGRRNYAQNIEDYYFPGSSNFEENVSIDRLTNFEQATLLEKNTFDSYALIGESISGKDLDQPNIYDSASFSQNSEIFNGFDRLNLEDKASSIKFENVSSLHLKSVRSLFKLMPVDQQLLDKAKVPLAMFFTPFSESEPVPTIDLIAQCRYCSSYPQSASLLSTDRELWRCLLCGFTSKFPNGILKSIDQCWPVIQNHHTYDILLEPKFTESPFLFFVIDTSYSAIKNGMLSSIIFSIKEILPKISQSLRVGFLTVNSTMQFYSFESFYECPTMVEMSEIDDPFVPFPSSLLLVPLEKYWSAVNVFLDTIESIFENTFHLNNCLGAALKAISLAQDFLVGSVIIFQTMIPSIGQGTIVKTGGTSILGTDKEHTLLNPKIDYYRSLSLCFSGKSISMDFFNFGSSDFDLPTIAPLVKYTGGSIYYYPDFNHSTDNSLGFNQPSHMDSLSDIKNKSTGGFDTLFADIYNLLFHRKAYSVTLRAIAPYGMSISNINGNLFRNSSSTAFTGAMGYGDSVCIEYLFEDRHYLTQKEEGLYANFQGIFTYVNRQGDKMARVLNSSLLCTSSISDLLSSVDSISYSSHLIRESLALISKNSFDTTRKNLRGVVLDFFKKYYQNIPNSKSALEKFFIPYNSRLLPYEINSAIKHTILQPGSLTTTNSRVFWQSIVGRCSPEILLDLLCPPILSLSLNDSMTPVVTRFNPSSERIACLKIFIMDFGRDLWCWVRQSVDNSLLSTFFNVNTYESLPSSKISLDNLPPVLYNILNQYFSSRPRFFSGRFPKSSGYLPSLILVKEGDTSNIHLRETFLSFMSEDLNQFGPSYHHFLMELQTTLQKSI